MDTLPDPAVKDDTRQAEPAHPGLRAQPGRRRAGRRRRPPAVLHPGRGRRGARRVPTGTGSTGPVTRVVSLNEACPATPVRRHLPGRDGASAPRSARTTRTAVVTPIRGDAPADPAVPADAVTASGCGLDPDISPAYAELQAARVAEARGADLGARPEPDRRAHHRPGARASSVSPRSTCSSSTSPWTSSTRTPAEPHGRRPRERRRPWRVDSCGSTSARPPAWARPTRCSTRATAGASAAPTSSSASSRRHGRPHTADLLDGLEVVPRRTIDLPRRDVHRDGRRRRAGPPARRSRWSTSWPTPTCPARATPSAGRTSRSCSTPAST